MTPADLGGISHQRRDLVETLSLQGQLRPERVPEIQTGPGKPCLLVDFAEASGEVVRVPLLSLRAREEPSAGNNPPLIPVEVVPQAAADVEQS